MSTTGPSYHHVPWTHSGPDAYRDQWQEVTNRVKVYPKRHEEHPLNNVRVRVRLVWERDGEEYVDTLATAWWRQLGYVVVSDHRWRFVGLWLHHRDIRRL